MFQQQRRPIDLCKCRAPQFGFGRVSGDPFGEFGIILCLEQAQAFGRRGSRRMSPCQQVQPERACLRADPRVGVVVREALHDPRIREALRSGDAHARVGVLARETAKVSDQLAIRVMGDGAAPLGRVFGLPTGFAEEGRQFHRALFTAGS